MDKGQAWAAQWEREHGQERTNGKFAALIEAVENRDAGAVLSHVTRDKATFQAFEVNRALAYGNLSGAEMADFRGQVLGAKNVIGLSDTRGDHVSRYTTVISLAPEMALMGDALKLEKQTHHGARAKGIDKADRRFYLEAGAGRRAAASDRRRRAYAILWGEAGTGKSHTLKATRAAYEARGKDVIGLVVDE